MLDCGVTSATVFVFLDACAHIDTSLRGAVAQLGARVNGIHEVAGSIPASSTKLSLFDLRSECVRGYPNPTSHTLDQPPVHTPALTLRSGYLAERFTPDHELLIHAST